MIATYILPSLLYTTIWFSTAKIKQNFIATSLIGIILGIYAQKTFTLPTTATIFIFMVAISIFLLTRNRNRHFTQCSYGFLFFASGALLLQAQLINYQSRVITIKNETLRARVCDKTERVGSFYKESLLLRPIQNNIQILCYTHTTTNMQPGDIVELSNITIKKRTYKKTKNARPTFDDFLIKENIASTVFLKKPEYVITKKSYSAQEWLNRQRADLYMRLKQKIPHRLFQYFSSIFLGNKASVYTDAQKRMFGMWGISHMLARSGLHIALFILLWKLLLSLLPFFFIGKQLIALGICIIYALFSWSSISFIRALFVFILFQAGIIFNRQPRILHLLQLIAIAVLIHNPMQLFFLDFQLSFALTIALSWGYQKTPGFS